MRDKKLEKKNEIQFPLNKSQILELVSYSAPPAAVCLCLEAVCILFETTEPPSLALSKIIMSHKDFISKCQSLQPSSLNPRIKQKLQK